MTLTARCTKQSFGSNIYSRIVGLPSCVTSAWSSSLTKMGVGTRSVNIEQGESVRSRPRLPCTAAANEPLYGPRYFCGGLCTAVYGQPFTQKSRTTNHVRAVYKTRNTSAALSCGETLAICILRLQPCSPHLGYHAAPPCRAVARRPAHHTISCFAFLPSTLTFTHTQNNNESIQTYLRWI